MEKEVLNIKQSRQYNRSRELTKFVNKNEETCALLPPFNKVKEDLLTNNSRLDKYIPIKTANGQGITEGKKDLKIEIGVQVYSICSLALSYAKTTGNKDLANSVNHPASYTIRLKDSEVLGFVNGLVSVITPLLTNPDFKDYPITEEALQKLTTDAVAFDGTIGAAKLVDSNSRIASKNIDSIFKDIRGNVAQFDLLIGWFQKNHPDFVKGYRTAAAIDYTGIHHSGIRGIITNSLTGQPVKAATILLKGKKNTKSAISGEDGDFEISKVLAGKCKLIISAPGYDSQTISVTILRGKIIEFNIGLQAQVINLSATA